MANFNTAYAVVHGNEGGWANTPGDKGGETYAGIARRWHPEWRGWIIIDSWKALHGQPSRGQFLEAAGLVDEVMSFYKAAWNEVRGAQIVSQPIANLLYDFATNSGRAVKVAQGVLVQMGYSVSVDNNVGPQTVAAINAANEVRYFNALKAARIAYVTQLAHDDPSQAKFLPEWLRRCNRFIDLQKKTLVLSPR